MAKTKHYDLDTDNTLGGNNASDIYIPSQKAVKAYVDNNFLQNAGTGTNSLALLGTATGSHGVGLGQAAEGTGSYSSGLGTGAKATGNYSIQIGYGTNSTASTLSVGFTASTTSARTNWQLLDGITGLIPDERLSANIARTSQIGDGTLSITQNGSTLGAVTMNQSGNTTIDIPLAATRNIGEIVTSTVPLTDAGLHLLDGALIDGSGIYSDFVDYIVGLVTDYPDLFETEANWQSAVTTYGVCGYYVYDSTNNTVRLPKVTGFVEGTLSASALGQLTEAGLPNITGVVGAIGASGATHTGAFYNYGKGGVLSNSGEADYNAGFNASRCSTIYGNSTTVQPQTTKVLYYIVISTSTKTDIEVDIDEIATDLNGKVDKSDLAEVQCVVETYQNGSSWYRIWSDGWCMQGGAKAAGATTITFIKPFVDTNYYFNEKVYKTDSTSAAWNYYSDKTTNSITILQGSEPGFWFACGYIEV